MLKCDVLHGYWNNAWGTMPESVFEREKRFLILKKQASKLIIPVFSHRYIPEYSPFLSDYPVISAVGRDVIIYGSDLFFISF